MEEPDIIVYRGGKLFRLSKTGIGEDPLFKGADFSPPLTQCDYKVIMRSNSKALWRRLRNGWRI